MAQSSSGWRGFWGPRMTQKCQKFLLPNLRWNQEIYGETLGQFLPRDSRWLDAGCGHQILGEGLEPIENELMNRVRLVVGADLQFHNIDQQRDLPLRLCADLNRLPFLSEKFQVISCNMVVEHLSDPRTTFRELTRVLAPGGYLILHTPNALSYVIYAGRLAKAVMPRQWIIGFIRWSESRSPEDVFPTFYRANTERKLRHFLNEVGLQEHSCRLLIGPQPMFRQFAPVALLELLLQRLSMVRCFRFLRSTIVAVYVKPNSTKTPAEPPDART